jgi:hypothetical protein
MANLKKIVSKCQIIKKIDLIFFTFYFLQQPHEVPEKWKSAINPRSRSLEDDSRQPKASTSATTTTTPTPTPTPTPTSTTMSAIMKKSIKLRKASLKIKKREKLETTLLRLLAKLPNFKDPIDASYLLESDNKRLRKKVAN